MIIHDFNQKPSIMSHFLAELRDKDVQKDAMRFRRNLERIAEIMAYEMSLQMSYVSRNVQTPLGMADMQFISESIVIATILRAGLPFHQGFLNYFDKAENAFVSAYREYSDSTDFEVHVDYIATPDLTGKTLILCDPMLATGQSLRLAYQALLGYGTALNIHIAGVVASPQCMTYIQEHFPENTHVWVAAIDKELSSKSYIVPGLGDAGDLAYGEKLRMNK